MTKKKKYALKNSYFKNRRPDDPDTPAEVVDFFNDHRELPFAYQGDNWSYDMVCERQKRRGVVSCQHLTPDATARVMAGLAARFSKERTAVDACCGTGQITKFLISVGFDVEAFDLDSDMLAVHRCLYPEVGASQHDIADHQANRRYPLVVSNPPFDQPIAQQFMRWLVTNLAKDGIAVLLLPAGYMEKKRPKTLAAILSSFAVLHREPVREKFFHARGSFEIVVLRNLDNYRM